MTKQRKFHEENENIDKTKSVHDDGNWFVCNELRHGGHPSASVPQLGTSTACQNSTTASQARSAAGQAASCRTTETFAERPEAAENAAAAAECAAGQAIAAEAAAANG